MSVVFFRTYFYFKFSPCSPTTMYIAASNQQCQFQKKKKKECETNVNDKSVLNVYGFHHFLFASLEGYQEEKNVSPIPPKKKSKS